MVCAEKVAGRCIHLAAPFAALPLSGCLPCSGYAAHRRAGTFAGLANSTRFDLV